MRVYADNAATTRTDPEILEKMLPVFTETYGNPSSIHTAGRDAFFVLKEARDRTAKALNALPDEIYFTSGGTEADNGAILGAAKKKAAKGSPSEQAAAKESGEPEASAEKKTGKTAKTPEHSVHRTTAVNVVKEAVPETKKAAKTSGKKAAAKKEGKEPQKTSEKPVRKSAKKADGKSVKKAAETESA